MIGAQWLSSVDVGVGQRVLILRLAEAAADVDVLAGLHEELRARAPAATLGRSRWMTCCAEASRSPNGLSWMNMRAVFSDELPPVAPTKPTTPPTPRDPSGRSPRAALASFGHRRERDVLPRLGLAEDEAGVLLGEEALGNDDVEIAGEDDQHERRDQHRELVAQHPLQAAVVDARPRRRRRPRPSGSSRPRLCVALALEEAARTSPASASARRRPTSRPRPSPSRRTRGTAGRRCRP